MIPAAARFVSGNAPSSEVLERVRRMLIQRYRMQSADVEDVISDSVVKFLTAPSEAKSDGLFVVIARRRAIDFLRSRSREVRLSERRQFEVPPNRDHLERELLARAIRRYASEKKNADVERLLAVAGRVLEGLSFVEACRESGIPRGSQNRYHKSLELFLDRLTRRRTLA